jgi:Flp pilus assembly protein TadG
MHTVAPVNHLGRSGERGQAIVELALTLPLLLLVVLGVFDFGLMFQRYEVVANAAREGARVGVLPDYTTANAQQRALDYLAVGGVTGPVKACGGALVAGSRCAEATPSDVVITGSSPAKTVKQITVVVEYDHRHIFVGPISQLFGGTLFVTRLRGTSTMRMEAR